MLLTEKEAAGKWCPKARDSNTGGNRARYGSGDASDVADYGCEMAAEFPCIGSACMAWRWSDPEYEFATTDNSHFKSGINSRVYEGEPSPPDGEGWEPVGPVARHATSMDHKAMQRRYRRLVPNRCGYCGAFGQPPA